MTKDPDTLPDSSDPNGPCPRCGRIAAFTMQANTVHHIVPDGTERSVILKCMGCDKSIVVIERTQSMAPPTYRPVHWWPLDGASDLDQSIPQDVSSAYSEGQRALSVKAPRAAAVMFRGMLAHVVKDKGSPAAQAKHTLFDRLEQMSNDGSLHPSLVEWARDIRILGNAAAHPDSLDPISEDEAADLARLCRQLLNVIYEVPARIARGRTARGSTPTPSS